MKLLKGFLFFFALATSTVPAQDGLAARIDDILKSWNKPDSPGAAVAVIRDGDVVFQKGYGIANLEYAIPITPSTVFHVASVSKQFTAMALVLLEQDGKLSLDDDIRKHLPELPDYRKPVTIRQLLHHTGGIRDQWQTLAIAGWRLDDVITQKQILNVMFRQKELNFPPATRHLYSNGGYTLAAEIVARASGKPFPQFCEERIFKPLEMSRTHFHDDHRRIVRDRAYSYARDGAGYQHAPLNYANAGATSLFTTAPDLARWLDNFRHGRVGGRAALDKIQQRAVLADGKTIDNGLGVAIGTFRGLATVSHGGGDAGYRSYALWFPSEKLGVAVVGNAGNFDSGGTANRVAAEFLKNKLQPEPPKAGSQRQFVQVDAATLDRYTGRYRMENGLVIEVEKSGGALRGGPVGQGKTEFKPLASNRFFVEMANAEVEFIAKSEGHMAIKLVQGSTTTGGERSTAPPPRGAELERYTGTYLSEELEARYTFFVRDGKLHARHIRHGDMALTAVDGDQFSSGQWFMPQVEFERDANGRVAGVKLGENRVTGIRFARQ